LSLLESVYLIDFFGSAGPAFDLPDFSSRSGLGFLAGWLLLGAFESARVYALVLGSGGIAAGILLFNNHKRDFREQIQKEKNARVVGFETRKFRRRTVANAMITSTGFMLASLFWVTDARVYSVFIFLILALLIGILGIAVFDLFSVWLHQLAATPDPVSQKKMIEDFLKQREAKKAESEASVEADPEPEE
jgi:hypothetical protein